MKFSTLLMAAAAAPGVLGACVRREEGKCPAYLITGAPGKIRTLCYKGNSFEELKPGIDAPGLTALAFIDKTSFYGTFENTDELVRYQIQEDMATIKQVGGPWKGSAGVVWLSMNQDKSRLLGAAYGSGKVDVWDVKGKEPKLLKSVEIGPKDKSNPHQANLAPIGGGRFFVVNDLKQDKLFVLDGKKNFDIVNEFDVTGDVKGCGARHGVFLPASSDDKEIGTQYVITCENKNHVIAYDMVEDEKKGLDFKFVAKVLTFKDGKQVEDARVGDIVTSTTGGKGPDNKEADVAKAHLYVANRLVGLPDNFGDSLAHIVFDRKAKSLKVTDDYRSMGLLPRKLALEPSGTQIITANMNGPIVFGSVLIDEETGDFKHAIAKLDAETFNTTEEMSGPAFVSFLP